MQLLLWMLIKKTKTSELNKMSGLLFRKSNIKDQISVIIMMIFFGSTPRFHLLNVNYNYVSYLTIQNIDNLIKILITDCNDLLIMIQLTVSSLYGPNFHIYSPTLYDIFSFIFRFNFDYCSGHKKYYNHTVN